MDRFRDAARALALIAALAALAAAAAPAPAAGQPEPADPCQDLYERGELPGARAACEEAVARDPAAYAARWRLARVLIDLGNKEQARPARQALYEAAERHAREAVRLNPQDTWGHHYLAASLGKLALFHGGKKKIELSREVRDEAQRAIELDPRNDRAHHVLGRWHREVANLGAIKKLAAKVVYGGVPAGASNEKAIEHLRRAVELNPRHVNHHLELGITYLRLERWDEATSEFETALALPEADPNDPEYKAEARRLIDSARRREARQQTDKSR